MERGEKERKKDMDGTERKEKDLNEKKENELRREIVYNYANPLMISAFYFCIECIRNM